MPGARFEDSAIRCKHKAHPAPASRDKRANDPNAVTLRV